MKYTARAFTMYKIAALVLSVAGMLQADVYETTIILKALVFLTLIAFECFIPSVFRRQASVLCNTILIITKIVVVIAILIIEPSYMCTFLTVYIVDLLYQLIRNRYDKPISFIVCSYVLAVLYIFIEQISIFSSTSIIVILSLLLGTLYLSELATKYRESLIKSHEEITSLNERLYDNQKLISTVKYSASLEERNRLAARLHDKIGHNISGSIIMLEAAMLQHEKNPEKAMESVRIATNNLQNGVDEIRMALREERPLLKDISSNDIRLLLDETGVKHGLHTFLKTDGDLNAIHVEQWKCIHDNATELITNTLKHSKSSSFTIAIYVLSSMIKVQYSDNGGCQGFTKGLGLQTVEERTVKYGGKCFFESDDEGFRTINIFFK